MGRGGCAQPLVKKTKNTFHIISNYRIALADIFLVVPEKNARLGVEKESQLFIHFHQLGYKTPGRHYTVTNR